MDIEELPPALANRPLKASLLEDDAAAVGLDAAAEVGLLVYGGVAVRDCGFEVEAKIEKASYCGRVGGVPVARRDDETDALLLPRGRALLVEPLDDG
jgi:hypothetical protein